MTKITQEEKTKRGQQLADRLGITRGSINGSYILPNAKYQITAAEIFDIVHEVCCQHHQEEMK